MRDLKEYSDTFSGKRVLYIGDLHKAGSTAVLRLIAMRKLFSGVDSINTIEKPLSLWSRIANRLFLLGVNVPLPDNSGENARIKRQVKDHQYDLIWIDKGLTVRPSTIEYMRRKCPGVVIVNFSPDNMVKRHCQSSQFIKSIPLYDYHITTKSFIENDLKLQGAKQVIFVDKTFEPDFHYPRNIGADDINRLGCDVGFIGAWELERMESILYLTRNGIRVRVWGPKEWQQCKNDNPNLTIENNGLYGDDYPRAFGCFKISLCFLRKINEDRQTARSIEIPACGGFMLAERTDEHMRLFNEGEEAEFFEDDAELLRKCRYYLDHEEERIKIASNGRRRCLESDYSNEGMLRRVISKIL